jgi:hypothetical protein
MSDKGIIFSAPMVRALLAGTKTQTRRILKPAPPPWIYPEDRPGYSCLTPQGQIEFRGRYVDPEGIDHGPASKFVKLPFLKGDRLWVRETWAVASIYDGKKPREINPEGTPLYCGIRYAATDERRGIKDRSCRFMPRWASRLWLEVTDVRVQRVQEISDTDAQAEGIERDPRYPNLWRRGPLSGDQNNVDCTAFPKLAYRSIWEGLHPMAGKRWIDNPWVVAVTFKVHRENIDKPAPRCPHGEPLVGGSCPECDRENEEWA